MSHQLPDGFTARPATTDDAGRIASLWNDRSEVTRGERPSTPARLLKTWDHPKFDLSTDSLLVFAPDGALIGYAHVRDVKEPPVDVFAGYSVHPDHDEDDWLWDCLFSWMDAEARRVIPKAPADARIALVAGTSEQDLTEQRELERHGFEHSRTFHRMTARFDQPAAPVGLPDGIAIRTFEPVADDIELVTVHREAFADHYGILRQPFETDLKEWHGLMQEDDFDASLWFLAYVIEDGSIVGLCTCYTAAPGDPARGLINDVGVRPTWRRRGIGQALLLHAFTELHRRGIEAAVLTVDSKNKSGAPALYERVGMHPVRASHT
jgi:mycothiol synthase